MNPQKRRSPGAVFAISFSISLAVLLAVVMTVMSVILRPRETGGTAGAEKTAEAVRYEPGEADALSLLVISCRRRSDSPDAFTLIRFDPANERLLLISIPPETVTTVGAKTGTFRKHYEYAGSENARLAAESLFLCRVGGYIRIAKSGAVNLIDALGGLECRFSSGYENEQVSVPPGEHLLSGELLYEIASAPPEGQEAESWRAGLYRDFLQQRLGKALIPRLDYLMESFWNNTDTDLSVFDWNARRRAAEAFLSAEGKAVEVRSLPGVWNGERTLFTADEAAVLEFRALLGAEEPEKEKGG